MEITREMNLTSFEFWSGAADTVRYLTHKELGTVESILNELYPKGMGATQLNDFFWFEEDTIAEWLGYYSFEMLMER